MPEVQKSTQQFDLDFALRLEDVDKVYGEDKNTPNGYISIPLKGKYSRCIPVPKEIILHENSKLLITYIYMGVRVGKDDCLLFSVRDITDWYGYSYDSLKEKIIEAIGYLEDNGYIKKNEEEIKCQKNRLSYLWCGKFFEEKFVMLYIDEIERILSLCRDKSKEEKALKPDTLFKVFTYIKLNVSVRNESAKVAIDPTKISETFSFSKIDAKKYLGIAVTVYPKYINALLRKKLLYKRNCCVEVDCGKKIHFKPIYCIPYVRDKGCVIRGGATYCKNEANAKYEFIKKCYIKNNGYEEHLDSSMMSDVSITGLFEDN